MPRYNLAEMARRQRNIRRSRIVLREINPPATKATDLFHRCYRPVVQLWQRRSERIAAEYERTLAQMTTDSPADIERELDEAENEFQRIVLELEPELRDWLLRVEQWQRGRWRGAVLSATGVDINTLVGAQDVRDTIDAYLRWNTSLIRDVSDQARKRITDRVFAGLNQRKPARDVAKEIREAVAMSRDRSIRIASDQLNKITNSLADERRREAGVNRWLWVHSKKRHPRADHVARNGKEYTDETAPQDRPGQLPYCGCRSRAVVTFD